MNRIEHVALFRAVLAALFSAVEVKNGIELSFASVADAL